jgi:phage-related protein
MAKFTVKYLAVAQRELNELSDYEQLDVLKYVELLEEWGHKLYFPFCRQIEKGLYELRPKKNRAFYFFYKDTIYIIVRIFKKKSPKTPRNEIRTAKQRIRNFLNG